MNGQTSIEPGSPDRARADFEAAARVYVRLAGRVGDEQWTAPGLGVWSVRDLVGHTSRALLTVETYLAAAAAGDDQGPPDLPDAATYYRAAMASLSDPAGVAERGRQAGTALGPDPAAAVRTNVDRVLALVAASPDDTRAATPVGSMRVVDYLPSRTFELVVHSLDLAVALGWNTGDAPDDLADDLAGLPIAGALALACDLAVAGGRGPDLLLALTGRRRLAEGFSVV